MHELGIVFHIVKTVENIALENQAEKVRKVVLQIGEVSTIIPYEDCEETYPTVQHGKICPYCGSEHTYLVQGNEHQIKEIEVSEE